MRHVKVFSLTVTVFMVWVTACWTPGLADEIHLESGKVVTGRITYEDDDRVEINSPDYGTLNFRKYTLKKVVRGSGTSIPSAPSAAPGFPAPAAPAAPSTGAFNPFAPPGAAPAAPSAPVPAAGAINPFGPPTTAPAAPAPAPAGAPINPFGAPGAPPAPPEAPSSPPGAINPFGPGAPGMASQPSASSFGAPPTGASPFGVPSPGFPGAAPAVAMPPSGSPPAIPTFAVSDAASRPPLPEPDIPPGADGVLFGIEQGHVVQLRKSGSTIWETAVNNISLMVGYEIRTEEGKAKIKLRGRDSLRLPPRSHIVLVQLSIDASEVTIQLKNGSLWTEVAPRARLSDFKVVTPDLTAGVRGTLFKTTVQTGMGSRVAVLQGSVDIQSIKTRAAATVSEATAVIVNPQGQIEPPMPILPAEYDEWKAWDEWRLDFYKNVASFSAVGAPILTGMADQIAQEQSQWAQTVNEANRQIVINRYEDNLKHYANAFMQFARDTGHVPNDTTESWQVLRENSGNWPGWNGPYLRDTSLPPLDLWRRPVRYIVRYSRSGNIHGIVYSEGLNQRDDKAQPGSDDILAYVMYYQLPNIATNPLYRPDAAAANAPRAPQ